MDRILYSSSMINTCTVFNVVIGKIFTMKCDEVQNDTVLFETVPCEILFYKNTHNPQYTSVHWFEEF